MQLRSGIASAIASLMVARLKSIPGRAPGSLMVTLALPVSRPVCNRSSARQSERQVEAQHAGVDEADRAFEYHGSNLEPRFELVRDFPGHDRRVRHRLQRLEVELGWYMHHG